MNAVMMMKMLMMMMMHLLAYSHFASSHGGCVPLAMGRAACADRRASPDRRASNVERRRASIVDREASTVVHLTAPRYWRLHLAFDESAVERRERLSAVDAEKARRQAAKNANKALYEEGDKRLWRLAATAAARSLFKLMAVIPQRDEETTNDDSMA